MEKRVSKGLGSQSSEEKLLNVGGREEKMVDGMGPKGYKKG